MAEQFYFLELNVHWLTIAYLALMIILPIGLHTDFSVLFARVDMLMSFLPVGIAD